MEIDPAYPIALVILGSLAATKAEFFPYAAGTVILFWVNVWRDYYLERKCPIYKCNILTSTQVISAKGMDYSQPK